MAKVIITEALFLEIEKRFNKKEANEIIDLIETLEENPKKGRPLGNVGGMLIKEIRYRKFRFYCITDGHKLKFGTEDELSSLIIKFVKISEKKNQKRVIIEIKDILRSLGLKGFK